MLKVSNIQWILEVERKILINLKQKQGEGYIINALLKKETKKGVSVVATATNSHRLGGS